MAATPLHPGDGEQAEAQQNEGTGLGNFLPGRRRHDAGLVQRGSVLKRDVCDTRQRSIEAAEEESHGVLGDFVRGKSAVRGGEVAPGAGDSMLHAVNAKSRKARCARRVRLLKSLGMTPSDAGMRITDATGTPTIRGGADCAKNGLFQREELMKEIRGAIAILQALTEKAQHEVFCRRTLAEMHGEIDHARRVLAEFERF